MLKRKRLPNRRSKSGFSPLLRLVGILSVVMVGLGLLVGLWALRQQQDLRQAADVIKPVNVIFKDRSSSTTAIVDIAINAGVYELTGVGFKGTLANTTTAKVKLNPSSGTGLQPIVTQTEQQGSNVVFYAYLFGSVDGSKPVKTNNADLTVLTIEIADPGSAGVQISLSSDSEVPVVERDDAPVNLPGSMTLKAVTATASPTSSAPPDQGIHRSCNEYCADSRECDSKYTCYFNRCRLPGNLTNEQCQALPSPTATPPTTSGTGGTGGTTRTTTRPASPKASPVVALVVSVDATPSPSPSPRVSPSPSPRTSTSPSPSARPSTKPSASPTAKPSSKTTRSSSSGSWIGTAIGVVIAIAVFAGIGFLVYKFLLGGGSPY